MLILMIRRVNLFGKFDQRGLMERYEYDGAGRLLKVYDKDGCLLREYEYKTLL